MNELTNFANPVVKPETFDQIQIGIASPDKIRSWSFGEDGSHGEGVWSKEDGSWFVRTSSVLPDGSTAAAVNVYQFDGGDTCTWQSFPTSPGADAPAPVTATMVRRKAR